MITPVFKEEGECCRVTSDAVPLSAPSADAQEGSPAGRGDADRMVGDPAAGWEELVTEHPKLELTVYPKLKRSIPRKPKRLPIAVAELRKQLRVTTSINEILDISAKADGLEEYMEACGFYSLEDMRPVNETRMEARWFLGKALAQIERGTGPGRGKKISGSEKSFLAVIREAGLDKNRAVDAQRLATLPEAELERAFAAAHKEGRLCYLSGLIEIARPYWYQASRVKKHQTIQAEASKAKKPDSFGPFPLIYADPPWRFNIYSEKGAERTADQHYPTLSDEEIKAYEVHGVPMESVAHRNAVLLLWCTSSNIHRALDVMEAWGFEYKTQAVWDKMVTSLGLVFRNRHEVLLYGTRGNMPGPQYQPSSMFTIKRGKHSEKPAEIRKAIEKMYPDFNAATRLELFARGSIRGWSTYGFEAKPERDAAE
jgi:N6-adenosine-specific RNA methylase IME4